jgi:hypothetical protein
MALRIVWCQQAEYVKYRIQSDYFTAHFFVLSFVQAAIYLTSYI